MKKWFISDTHFSHTNIIRYTGRPFETVEEMNRCLIKNWNDCIDANDQVFFLGDFGLGDVDHLHSISPHFQLHGHVHEKRSSKIISNQLNLCVEVWNYKPVAEKVILSLLDKAAKNQISPDVHQDNI